MNSIKYLRPRWVMVLLFLFVIIQSWAKKSQEYTLQFADVYSSYEHGVLIIGNKSIERTWKFTNYGLQTVGMINKGTGKNYININSTENADWQLLPGMDMAGAQLKNIEAVINDDKGFTSQHIEVVATIQYPKANMAVKYKLWCYPNIGGIRSQLLVKTLDTKSWQLTSVGNGLPKSEMSASATGGFEDQIIKGMHWTTGEFDKGPTFTPAPESAIDGDIMTFWRTKKSSLEPEQANEFVLDLKKVRTLESVGVIGPQDYAKDGCPEHIVAQLSVDSVNWGHVVATTPFHRSRKEYLLPLKGMKARFVKLVMKPTGHHYLNNWCSSLSEVNVYTNEYPYNKVVNVPTDFIPVNNIEGFERKAIGYEMDTQFRPSVDDDFYKEEIHTGTVTHAEKIDWANILCLSQTDEGIMLVKESHKTAVEPGYYTGAFTVSQQGVSCSGWGMDPIEMSESFQECWANWLIVYKGGEDERSLVLKQFDRLRFPTDLPGHQSINACTWGGGTNGRTNRDLGQEVHVLKELESLADLGIQCLGIDDGWQLNKTSSDILPDSSNGWYPHKAVYPTGDWSRVKAKADSLGIRLSLWTIAQSIDDKALYWNQEHGKFQHWKFDFVDIDSYKAKAKVQERIRQFIGDHDHNVGIAWDLTESVPRFGLFWMREYGFLWLANRRRDIQSRKILYSPSNMLKMVWDLSKNINSNKLEIALVDVRQVAQPSDASWHSMQYAMAISLTGIPMYFDYTSHYLPETRAEIKEMLPKQKEHQAQMKDCYVFPIGEQPNNDQITGFQYFNVQLNEGYLLLFRELNCEKNKDVVNLKFLRNCKLECTNIMTGEQFDAKVGENGEFLIEIDQPAEFKWLKIKYN